MLESLWGAIGAQEGVGTATLATVAAFSLAMAALALVGGRFLSVLKGAATTILIVGLGVAGLLALRDGAATQIIGDLVARVEPSAVHTRAAPAHEAPRSTTSGYREVVAYMDGGSFALGGRANGVPLDFVFDTGATAVVLTADDAARLGWPASRLDYSVTVSTANGATRAAPITIERLAIGSIEERSVRALVARPGDLRENLLGMTFLTRLDAYEVRGDRLVLRGR